jgi:two-component system, response regulator PdtaR
MRSVSPRRHSAARPPGSGSAGEHGAEAASRPRVLVAEDDYLVALELEAGLKDAGFEVIGIAASADDALRLAESGRPVLAIMDIRLAGPRDGIDAALELFRRNGIRSIFATAHLDARTRARAEAAAPLGWLPKPYALDTLVATIERALRALGRPPRDVPGT